MNTNRTPARSPMMKYVKDKKGRKIGMLLAKLSSDRTTVYFGWSRCKEGDVFDRETGMEQAWANMGMPIPPSFEKAAKAFRLQCVDHFDQIERFQRIKVMEYVKQPKKPKGDLVHPAVAKLHDLMKQGKIF